MITELRLCNFKSWRETGHVRLAPITALFGTNSSGKTSLLQALLMLKQTVESPDRARVLNLGGDVRSPVDLGSFRDVLFRHNLKLPLEFEISWDGTRTYWDGGIERLLLPGRRMSGFSARLHWLPGQGKSLGRAVVDRMTYFQDGDELGMQRAKDGRKGYDLFASEPQPDPLLGDNEGMATLPPPAKFYGFPDLLRAQYPWLSDNASWQELQFESLFSRLYYLGPLREDARRVYRWTGSQPSDVGRRGEFAVDALLASREWAGSDPSERRGRSADLEAHVAESLKTLGLIHSFEVSPLAGASNLFQVWVRRSAKGSKVLLTDVGFGVSQVLPVVTLCHYVPEGSTVIFEQPEIHLHPSAQSELGSVLTDVAKTRKLQIVIESHSEHLLRRIQRRIAEETFEAQDAALYFCSLKENGESRLTALRLDEFGNISNWPEHFFGDEFGEIAATAQAALARKRRVAAG